MNILDTSIRLQTISLEAINKEIKSSGYRIKYSPSCKEFQILYEEKIEQRIPNIVDAIAFLSRRTRVKISLKERVTGK